MTTREKMQYEVTHIAIKHLSVIWRKSQRPFDQKWAQELADGFDPEKYEPAIVTKPNGAGIFHIIEGQHRVKAAELAFGSNEQIACRVIGEADPARAAEIWLGINGGRKQVRPIQEFLVAVEAGRDLECAINKIVRRAEYRVSESTMQENVIGAVAALRRIYNNYGEEILLKTLNACRYLWGNDPGGVKGHILRGLSMFLNEFSAHVDMSHLRKVLHAQYTSPRKFIDAAKVEADKSSESMEIAMSELFRMKYNKSQRDNKKLKRKAAN